ncbi:uncharacterized protein EV420DRAFT_1006627 [Desarmillaria tabescens]|uniref:Uncharacterized protein n=1 Tax=Armillaria tabescens TaxID=1929756 RepID=A0AA39JK30_ARMTA|nr:uncharacterized protein EV420DRAFT_1006627 [Desarmillaria tabescens]KAK0444201.1 hypothetical protein EV420DRAFT_1006627 [Desarmillaria tabescens]
MFSKALCAVLLGLCFSALAVEAAPHRGGYARSAVGNGNTHVRIEELDSLDHDPRTFKDVNRAIANDAVVTTNVAKGLLVGARQADSIDSAANHQPVIQPTAQRGSQDDNATVRFQDVMLSCGFLSLITLTSSLLSQASLQPLRVSWLPQRLARLPPMLSKVSLLVPARSLNMVPRMMVPLSLTSQASRLWLLRVSRLLQRSARSPPVLSKVTLLVPARSFSRSLSVVPRMILSM